MSRSIRIAVAEPSIIIRSGVVTVLKQLNTLNIQILEISEIAQIASSLSWQKPDILIINPAFLGLFSLQQIKNESGCRDIKCIALTYSANDSAMLKSYDDSVSVHDTVEQIKDKIEKLKDEPGKVEKRQESLSAREKEIIVCVVKGMTNKQIADELCLSAHTVITHRRNIANKLQIHSSAGLTIYAIVNKLVELNDIKSTISDQNV